MKRFYEQILGEVTKLCGPAGVEVVPDLVGGAPKAVTVQVRPQGQACDVVLYSGGPAPQNSALVAELDGKLIRVLSQPPYRMIEHTRGTAFGSRYRVGRC